MHRTREDRLRGEGPRGKVHGHAGTPRRHRVRLPLPGGHLPYVQTFQGVGVPIWQGRGRCFMGWEVPSLCCRGTDTSPRVRARRRECLRDAGPSAEPRRAAAPLRPGCFWPDGGTCFSSSPESRDTRLQNDGEALRAGRSRGRPGPPLPCAHPRRHPHPRFCHGRAAAPPLRAFGGAFRLSALSLEKDFQRILSGHGTVQLTLIQNDAECQLWLNKEEIINKRTLKKYT